MKLLIIAATQKEINGIESKLSGIPAEIKIDLNVTGIGCMQTCYHLLDILNKNQYDFVLQIGIAGTLDETISIGSICQVYTERLVDLGSEDYNGELIDVFELGLMDVNEVPFTNGKLINESVIDLTNVALVQGCTLNKTSGTNQSIARLKAKYPYCQVESMEGAALFYVCKNKNIKFIELRAISNLVEERNRENWNIKLALLNIEDNIEDIILKIAEQHQ